MNTPSNSSTAGAEIRSFRRRVSAFYAAMFIAMGAAMPYLNAWFAGQGLTIEEIALLATLSPLVRVFGGPVIAFWADRRHAHRQALLLSAWVSLLAWLLLSRASGFKWLLLGHLFVSLAGSGMMPLIENIATSGVRRYGVDYGRMRLWGSASFIVAAIVGGWLIDRTSIGSAVYIMTFGALVSVVVAHFLPNDNRELERSNVNRPVRLADAARLVRSPQFLTFLLCASLLQGAHAVFYVFGVLHWQSLGLSSGACGWLWAISVIAEIALFYLAGGSQRSWGPIALMGSGAIAATIRWFATGFDPPLLLLVPLQILHAFTYAASHLGAIQFIARAVPPGYGGTAQAVYAVCSGGIAAMIANRCAGVAYGAYGGRAYWMMAAFAIAALVALWLLNRIWSGGTIGGLDKES